ncbi:MAG TPA: hypothetical protein VGV87_18545 [Blastocatellia bacterium]|nr:hypothetical protein [Blastocatellia bacterium]
MNRRSVTTALMFFLICSAGLANQGRSETNQVQPAIKDIITKFAAAESQNKIARNQYIFTQDVDVMTLGEAGSVTGRFRRTSDIVYDDLGKRFEKITFFPPSTLQVNMTNEDMQDMAGVQPFALTTEDLPKYQVDYVGKEKIDELNLYVFEIKPKEIRKGERYFQGRIYVDDHDLQIVKVAGQAVPEFDNNRYPHFETYRENIDGRYWFPTYTYGDDVLQFKQGPIRLRMVIKFTNYKKFSGNIRLIDDGAAAATDDDVKSHENDKKATDKEKEKKPPEPPTPPVEKPKRKPHP